MNNEPKGEGVQVHPLPRWRTLPLTRLISKMQLESREQQVLFHLTTEKYFEEKLTFACLTHLHTKAKKAKGFEKYFFLAGIAGT
jgi:hypothetical protein